MASSPSACDPFAARAACPAWQPNRANNQIDPMHERVCIVVAVHRRHTLHSQLCPFRVQPYVPENTRSGSESPHGCSGNLLNSRALRHWPKRAGGRSAGASIRQTEHSSGEIPRCVVGARPPSADTVPQTLPLRGRNGRRDDCGDEPAKPKRAHSTHRGGTWKGHSCMRIAFDRSRPRTFPPLSLPSPFTSSHPRHSRSLSLSLSPLGASDESVRLAEEVRYLSRCAQGSHGADHHGSTRCVGTGGGRGWRACGAIREHSGPVCGCSLCVGVSVFSLPQCHCSAVSWSSTFSSPSS